MRWVLFLLLAAGALFSLSVLLPAPGGHAGFFHPLAIDSESTVRVTGRVVAACLGAAAAALFASSAAGLFWNALSVGWWRVLVVSAASLSLAIFTPHFGRPVFAPVLVDVVLLWGALTGRWSTELIRLRDPRKAAGRMNPFLHIPVPWVYVLIYLGALVFQYALPLGIAPALAAIARIAGVLLIAAGSILAFSGLGIFKKQGTTTVPFETPSKLVTWGPYRFTRNPMYVGLALVYLGVAATNAQIWPVLVLPMLLAYIHRVVIPAEEARLHAAFGDAYAQYRTRVHRWL
jgi:protein-S-isoprenylcysteine O-methyltransferase Ste14